jgi:hypothetical protein
MRSVKVTIRDEGRSSGLAARIAGALLCLGVAAIHVIDQGGIPGSKTPEYVGVGYWILEIIAVVTAGMLIANWPRPGWFVALGVAAGPLIGYVLSRGPGLPDYTDDKGNWTEPIGLLSIAVELTLLGLAAALFLRHARTHPPAPINARLNATGKR